VYAEFDFILATSRREDFERLHLRANGVFGERAKTSNKAAKPAQKCDFNVTTNFARNFLW
jgi:hypothetical protein